MGILVAGGFLSVVTLAPWAAHAQSVATAANQSAPTPIPATAAISLPPTQGSVPNQTAPPATDPWAERTARMVREIGEARVTAGLLPLARSPELDRAATLHAQDMAAQGYMEHEGLDGSTPGSRAAAQGYVTPAGSAWMVLEAISAMGDAPEDALGWWLGDSLHRRLVLRSTWREVGIGYAPGGPYGRMWVALFGCRPNALPPVLLDGDLYIPDETCGAGAGDIGPLKSDRVAATSDALPAPWESYLAMRPWPAGRSAVVQEEDATGTAITARAQDLTAPTTTGH